MKPEYDIIVIGAGSAGLTAAIGGVGIGAKVLLVEKEKIGGDCTHHGCVPSKTLIKAARLAREISEIENYGLHKTKKPELDLKKVLEKVQSTVDSIYEHETPEAIKKLGVDVEIGNPKFINENSISINGKTISARKIVIATGSRPRVPQIKGLDKIKYMTNKTIFDPKKYNSIAILGAGPIGCELGQALKSLGVDVTIIATTDQVLAREDNEAAMLVQEQFKKDGINLILSSNVLEVKQKGSKKVLNIENSKTNKIKSIEVDEILISIGRVPNVENLDLEKANVTYNNRGIDINEKGQTSNKNIFAVGDITGGMQFTHLANSHAKSALASIIFKIPAKYETVVIPRVTFTTPEIACVGILEKDKEESDIVLKKGYDKVDRAITDSNTDGFYKIIVDKKGLIKGATIVGHAAGELIGEIAVAMKNKIPITKLADTIHPYPTYGYGLRNTFDGFRALGYTEKKKNLVKKIFGLRGN